MSISGPYMVVLELRVVRVIGRMESDFLCSKLNVWEESNRLFPVSRPSCAWLPSKAVFIQISLRLQTWAHYEKKIWHVWVCNCWTVTKGPLSVQISSDILYSTGICWTKINVTIMYQENSNQELFLWWSITDEWPILKCYIILSK